MRKKYKYTHWLKIENDMVIDVWKNIKEYEEKYDCNIEIFYRRTNLINKFIKLECNQSYQDLNLDINSMSDGSLIHLLSKPRNIYKYKHSIKEFYLRILQCKEY